MSAYPAGWILKTEDGCLSCAENRLSEKTPRRRRWAKCSVPLDEREFSYIFRVPLGL